MKLIHTSDWHIGRSLYGRKRYDEFEAFLTWLGDLIEKEEVEGLLVSGDVFDNGMPSNRSQSLYYRFLFRMIESPCRHVVIVAGNHDSPSFLNAPRQLLTHVNVHVVGNKCGNPADEVLTLSDASGAPELIVCAIPYLRDRDIRKAEAGESSRDKERKLVEGIRDHFRDVCHAAEERRARLAQPVPIVAMGHLFTSGGRTISDDGVRELYVGSLAHVGADLFPECIDYLALGHLHIPQLVDNCPTKRYSGSPLPMGFGEASQVKTVCRVELSDGGVAVSDIPIPTFQRLERIRGDWTRIAQRLEVLKTRDSDAWLEIVYEDKAPGGNLRERLEAAVSGTAMEILRVKNDRIMARALRKMASEETLDDLDVNDVFTRCLDAHEVPEIQREDLLGAYRETLTALYEDDAMAE